jgi:hypothetical protein
MTITSWHGLKQWLTKQINICYLDFLQIIFKVMHIVSRGYGLKQWPKQINICYLEFLSWSEHGLFKTISFRVSVKVHPVRRCCVPCASFYVLFKCASSAVSRICGLHNSTFYQCLRVTEASVNDLSVVMVDFVYRGGNQKTVA